MKRVEAVEYAAVNKVRFNTPVGSITFEDLYQLPMTKDRGLSLDSVSQEVLSDKSNSPKASLVSKPSKIDIETEVKIMLLEMAIEYRSKETDKAIVEAKNKARVAKIKELLLLKDNKADSKLSREALEKELASLQ